MVVLLAIIYNIPSFFEHDIKDVPNDCLSRVERRLVHSAMRSNKHYFILYKTLAYFLFRLLFPLASLTFLNFRLMYTLWRQFHHRQQLFHADTPPEIVVERRLSDAPRLRRCNSPTDPSVTMLVEGYVERGNFERGRVGPL